MAEEVANGPSVGVAVSGVSLQVSVSVSKAEEAVTFYKAAFGAEEVNRSFSSKRKADQEQPSLLCAELKIGGASFLICGVLDDSPAVKEATAVPVQVRVQVDNTEAAVNKAVQAGAVLSGEVGEDTSCCAGNSGVVVDPFGVSWVLVSACSTKPTTEAEA